MKTYLILQIPLRWLLFLGGPQAFTQACLCRTLQLSDHHGHQILRSIRLQLLTGNNLWPWTIHVKTKLETNFDDFWSFGDFLSTKVTRRFQIYSGSNKASLVNCICLNFVKLPYSVITYPVFLSISELSLANTHAKATVINSVVWLGHGLWLLE